MEPRFIVYGLIDPRNGELRYVGKSTYGLKRTRERHNAHCKNWMTQLKNDGLIPDVEILEVHEDKETLAAAEIFFIAYFRSIGCRLTNMTNGGEGRSGMAVSASTRKKLSEAHKGNQYSLGVIRSEESKIAQSKRALKQFADPEERRKLSERAKLQLTDPKLRESFLNAGARVQANKRKPVVDENGTIYESCADAAARLGIASGNVSQSARKLYKVNGHRFSFVGGAQNEERPMKPRSAEHIRKISEALTGRTMSQEARLNLSRAQGGRPFQDQNGAIYHTQPEAARALGLKQQDIHRILASKRKSTKGYTFKYVE